jgi:hypothetical protein
MNSFKESCYNILVQNMWYENQSIYLLYDTESPLAKILSQAWISVLSKIDTWTVREFKNPPQPLYRGGLINPDNPHINQQSRIITSHNIEENTRIWLNHHLVIETKNNEDIVDSEVNIIKNDLISLPKGSIVILVQSTNFRLSTFRIRLELFNRGIHVVEFNHLAYIPEEEFLIFEESLMYRTTEYVRLHNKFEELANWVQSTRIQSLNGEMLVFWPIEKIRGNTGDYSHSENKGWTFPIWETFTEAIDLVNVNGKCLIDSYPREDFSVEICKPFELIIENGRVLPSDHFPVTFSKLYNWIVQFEWEVLVRELGFGLNPAISTDNPLSDIDFYERKVWVHLSLWKKHGIYWKKLPKSETQRFHIDVFVALESVYIGENKIFANGKWIV